MVVESGAVAEVRLATHAMATRFELVVQGEDPVSLQGIGEEAIEEIETAHRMFTRFESSSLLSHLRRTAPKPVSVDRATLQLFEDIDGLVRGSQGGFDPTCGHRWNRVRIDRDRWQIGLDDGGIELDLGAVAKGYAVDRAAAVLRLNRVTSAFVHGGTSSGLAVGRPAGQPGWRVKFGTDGPRVDLVDQAFGMSASYQLREGRDVPHLTDPRTKRVLGSRRRGVVVGPNARLADGWSTAAVVLGRRPPELGAEWRLWLADQRGWKEFD
jgi:thiamine biosynthesis lipoprotein